MRSILKYRWLLLLFLPVPLGFWLLLTFFLGRGSSSDQTSFFFVIAALLHSLVLLPIARSRPRAISNILLPTAFLIAAIIIYSFSENWLPGLIILLAVVGYPGSLLLRNMPSVGYLREMGLIGRTGLAIVFALLLFMVEETLSNQLDNSVIVDLSLFGFLILAIVLIWKPANTWWRKTYLLLSLLAAVITGFLLTFFLLPLGPGDNTFLPETVTSIINWTLGSLLFTSGAMLGMAGLRFALYHRPRPQALREAELLDWRGLFFLGGLVLSSAFWAVFITEWITLPLGEVGVIIVLILFATAMALYWTPAKNWLEDRRSVRLSASVAILAGVSGLILAIIGPFTSGAIETILISFITIAFLVLAPAFGIVALLPWIRSMAEVWAPTLRKQVGWGSLILITIIGLESFVFLSDLDTLDYFIWAGSGTLLAAFFVTPWLSHFGKRRWLAGVAVGVLILSALLLLNRRNLSQVVDVLLPSDILNSNEWPIFAVGFLLHLLATLSLALLASYRTLRRAVLAAILFIAIAFIAFDMSWRVTNLGNPTTYVWLGLFGVGWLLAPLLPKRLERWSTVVWSGLLLLILFTLLHLPLFPNPSPLETYKLSLPLWIGEQTAAEPVLQIGLLIILAAVLAALSFAALVGSGQAVLSRSRPPKQDAVMISGLFLAVFLALASSYIFSPNSVINRLDNGLWTVVTPPEGFEGQFSQLLADQGGAIWVGTNNGEVARFDGQWEVLSSSSGAAVKSIYEGRNGRIWVVTSSKLNVFDRRTGQSSASYNPQALRLPNNTTLNVIYQDGQGQIWVGTDRGLLRLTDRSLLTHEESEFQRDVQQIGEDRAGNLWYRTGDDVYYPPKDFENLARRISKNSDLTYLIDLTTVPPETSATLNLAIFLNFKSESEYSLVEFSSDGGKQWQCVAPTSPIDVTRVAQCGLTGDLRWGFRTDFDLSQYIGQKVLVRLSYQSEVPRRSTGAWNLLGSELKLGDEQMAIPLAAWSGNGTERMWTQFEPYQVMLSANNFDAPIFTWRGHDNEIYYGSQSLGVRRLGPLGLSEPEPILNDEIFRVNAVLRDSAGRIWLAHEFGSLLVSSDRDTWQGLSEIGLEKDISRVTTIMEQGDKLWFAGQIWYPDTDQGHYRHVIAEYSPQAGPDSFRVYDTVSSSLAVGEVETLVTDTSGTVWALVVDNTYLPVSSLWFLLPVLALVGLGHREYSQQPQTRARRFGQKLQAESETALSQMYRLLQTDSDGGDILSHLSNQTSPVPRKEWKQLAQALTQIAPNRPLADSRMLGDIGEQLASASETQYAAEIGGFYQFLADASSAKTVNEIADWPVKVIRGEVEASPMLVGDTLEPIQLPSFIDGRTVDTLESLSQTSTVLGKYLQVDSSQDKLVYLADALAAAERAARDAATANPPEDRYLGSIALEWAQIVRTELNNFSGRAELRLELRTRQIRRAEEVTLSLRLQNIGRAAAENIVIALQPGADFSPTTETQVRLERLSSGSPAPIEFTIAPTEAERARIICQITWDDRVDKANSVLFADEVRFYEVAEEFKRIPNPYIVGHPVKSADMFHGREDIFNFIEENLNGPVQDRTLVLHGQRRTGKTSILYQLLRGRLGTKFLPVLVDMQELALLVNNTGDFLSEVAYQLARAAQKINATLETPAPESFSSSPTRTFNRFLDELEDSLDNRRVVVMFDEFEIIESKIADGKLEADLLNYFRSLMQHRDQIIFIFTGTHRMEEMSHDYWSIFFNIALYRRVSFLNPRDATRLIRQPVAGELDVDELAVEKIIDLTRGHAYFIQLICWALVNHCNAQKRNYATINDVNDSVEEILTTGEAHFAYIWQQATSIERSALVGLAHTIQPGKSWARPSEILATLAAGGDTQTQREELVDTLDHLVSQEILEAAGEGTLRYRFQIEVLRLWVQANKSVAGFIERR